MIRFGKKGQEEAVGFVAIIVIAAVVLAFFIGMSLKDDKAATGEKSVEIKQFLEASYRYTTDCELSLVNKYADIGDVMRACHQNDMASCFDGRNVCAVYNSTMKQNIDASFTIGKDYPVKGYIFNATYGSGAMSYPVMELQKGNCTGDYKAEEYLSPDILMKGTYTMQLKLCS